MELTEGGIIIVVPMKALHLAKSRLSTRLESAERAALSLAMLKRVVNAATRSSAREVWVVGGDTTVRQTTSSLGATWYPEDGISLNESLEQAFRVVSATGLAAMYLPADLPFVETGDIDEFIEFSGGGQRLTLASARRDGGTNAILVPSDSPFRPSLGSGSFKRHQEHANALGLSVTICNNAGLGYDLDTPEDLAAYEEMQPGFLAKLTNEASAHCKR